MVPSTTTAPAPAARRCGAGTGPAPVTRGLLASRYSAAAAARAMLTCRHASASTAGPASATLASGPASPAARPSASEPSRALATPAHIPLAPTLQSLLLSAASGLPCMLLAAAASSASEVAATASAPAAATAAATAAASLPASPPAAATAAAVVAPMVFEPQAPDAGVLAAQALVLLLTAGAGAYWWYVVVPTERAAVGRSKRLGALNSYLGELEAPQAVQERKLERWFYTDWLQQREKRRQRLGQNPAGASASASAAVTNTSTSTPGAPDPNPNPEDPYFRQGVPYNDDLLRPTVDTPTPRFLSLDNPLVATAALLTAVGLLSTLLHGP